MDEKPLPLPCPRAVCLSLHSSELANSKKNLTQMFSTFNKREKGEGRGEDSEGGKARERKRMWRRKENKKKRECKGREEEGNG